MLRLILTRLLAALPNLAGVVVITFVLTRALPGDPAAYFAGGSGHARGGGPGACTTGAGPADG